jgi:hypothetical protein
MHVYAGGSDAEVRCLQVLLVALMALLRALIVWLLQLCCMMPIAAAAASCKR